MDKPDWSDAPDWARYLAQDKDGEWWWYEHMPEKCRENWQLNRCIGKSEKAYKEAWTISLEERP